MHPDSASDVDFATLRRAMVRSTAPARRAEPGLPLDAARTAELRRRIAAGVYESEAMMWHVARALLRSGDL